jgi:hypothetical protein
VKKRVEFFCLFLIVFALSSEGKVFSDPMTGDPSAPAPIASTPFLLSLIFSHGAGLYALDQAQIANPYLLSNIFLVDIPLISLLGGIIVNKVNPDIFRGEVLGVTEYVVNAFLVCVLLSAPVIRIFECRDVLRHRDTGLN